MDASDSGLQMAAANSLAPENVVRLSLQLGAFAEPVEVEARVVWLSESKKTGGFEFVSLTDEARDQIREWLCGDAASAPSSGPKAVPTRVRDQRTIEAGREAGANGAIPEIRRPVASDSAPRGFETMFPPEGQPIPSGDVHEAAAPDVVSAESHVASRSVREAPVGRRLIDDRVPRLSPIREPAPSRGDPIGERPSNPDRFHEREPLRPPPTESRFPARAIFADSPFQTPPREPPRWSNARMGLLTGVVMVICFAVGMIAGRVWMGRWPQSWNLEALTGGASAPAQTPPPPAEATAPAEGPAANPEANSKAAPDATAKTTPDADGNSAAPASTPPAVATPATPESSGAISDAGAAPTPSAKQNTKENTPASEEALAPQLAGNSILVTAPAAGSPSVRVSLPQEPLTASASVAIGVKRSALLPPQSGPVSAHSPERLEFGKIIAQVPDVLSPNIPPMGDPIVVLRVTIGEQGEIKSLVPIRGRDELIPKAERLVREWQQFPARLGGQPIESTEEIILTFRTGP